MKLVRKDRYHTTVRFLNSNEKAALHNVFGAGRRASEREEDIVKRVISEMDKFSLYIECDCLPTGTSQPLSCEVEKTFIRRVKSAPEHDGHCPLFHLRKHRARETDEEEGNEGAIAPMVPVDINDIFTRKVKPGTPGPGVNEPHGRRRRSRLKPVPALGRLLFTLLEGAGINTMNLLPDVQTPGLTTVLSSLYSYIQSLSFRNGVIASRVITTRTNITPEEQDQMLSYLESNHLDWQGDREREFFLIGYSESLETNKVTFRLKGKELPPFLTAKPIKTFGESIQNIGTKAPYWVILRFRRGDNGKVYCDEGYAHCAFKKHNPIPVDSDKERATLRTIERAAEYIRTQNLKAGKPQPTLTVRKPLFTVTVPGDDGNPTEVHPDFLIEFLPTGSQNSLNIVVETMGYDSPDYLERKQRTHPGMRELGLLLTDPYGYPHKSDRSFMQELLSCLFQPERHRQV